MPCGVCTTSGWNCTPYNERSRDSNAATGVAGELATTVAPSGAATTVSRCDIHTVWSAGVSFSSCDSVTCMAVLPNSETPVRSTRPPRSSASSCAP